MMNIREETKEKAHRRQKASEETRQCVMNAVRDTVMEIGYYKSSSNEIARRAGVTWGTIQHLFGSREQLMLDVVNDIGRKLEERLAGTIVKDGTLEERLDHILQILGSHYGQDVYIVQMQILLDLSANPKMSERRNAVIEAQSVKYYDRLIEPLLQQLIGPAVQDASLALYVFDVFTGYLAAQSISRVILKLPPGAIVRLMKRKANEDEIRQMIIKSVATTIREHAQFNEGTGIA